MVGKIFALSASLTGEVIVRDRLFYGLTLSLCCFLGLGGSYASAGLRTLYVTDYDNLYHDYYATQVTLQRELQQRIPLDFTLVGEHGRDSLALLKTPGFLKGYQLFIYNACFADLADVELMGNIDQEIRSSGVPTVFLHCAMHNFRWSSSSPGIYGIGKSKRLQADWQRMYPDREYPAWWKLTGMDSISHKWIGSFPVVKSGNHPITAELPATWTLTRDEQYETIQLADAVVPLLRSGANTVAWLHCLPKTNVFATTLGHDQNTQTDPPYIELLRRGILFITAPRSAEGTMCDRREPP